MISLSQQLVSPSLAEKVWKKKRKKQVIYSFVKIILDEVELVF